MKSEPARHSPVLLIHLIGLIFLAAGLAINPYRIVRSFFSDEAVYYTMAYSFATDGDMDFQRKDLHRVYRESAAGPSGIVLKLNERDGTIVFGKSFLYSLTAAPFVRAFKTNGFVIWNAFLLWLNLLCGYRFCSAIMQPHKAILFSLFYFLANTSLLYLFWMTPEYFVMSLICYAFFFFVSAEYLKSSKRIFSSPFNYCLSAIFFAMATYAKPTNAILVLPLGIWMLYKRKMLPALLTLAVYIFATVGLFGMNVFFTGQWNYQGGMRALFYKRYPFENPSVSEFVPFTATRPIEAMVRAPFYIEAFSNNWLYFFFGRFSGLAIYFFPMFFVLLYFLFSKKNGLSLAVYAAGWLGILTYMILLPWNYFGGSGTVGNRYLMNAFPILLFCVTHEPSSKWLTTGLLTSLLFTSVFLCTPVFSSFNVAFHQERPLFRLLPLEKTLLVDLPINNNPRARRVYFDQPAKYLAYFIDDNTYFKDTYESLSGFWVKGERNAELVLRTFQPASQMRVRLKSLQPNVVTISINGTKSTIALKDPALTDVEIKMPPPFPYDRDNTGATYLYRIQIHSRSGIIWHGPQERYLGVFVRIEIPDVKGVAIAPEG